MVLLLAGQALAGGIACGIDALSNGFNSTGEAACSIQKTGECDEMACCLQGKSPTGAVVAMVCCEIRCGESTGGAQFDFATSENNYTVIELDPTTGRARVWWIDADGSTEPAAHALQDLVYGLMAGRGGSISAEHGIGLLKRDYLHYSRSPAELLLLQALKRTLDPHNILNPGKIFAL